MCALPATPTIRHSPIQAALERRQPRWELVGGAQLATCFQTEAIEQSARDRLGLCDLSVLTKLAIKGRDSADWLRGQGILVPEGTYSTGRLPDGGIVACMAEGEFFLESGIANETVPVLQAQQQGSQAHMYSLPRNDATFLLVGSRALEVLAQACGIHFARAEPDRVVMTRVAGVSCAVLPASVQAVWAYRLWIDYCYAPYLWERLVEIMDSLGGSVIGAGCVFDELRG